MNQAKVLDWVIRYHNNYLEIVNGCKRLVKSN